MQLWMESNSYINMIKDAKLDNHIRYLNETNYVTIEC